jgi:hypothetical protein
MGCLMRQVEKWIRGGRGGLHALRKEREEGFIRCSWSGSERSVASGNHHGKRVDASKQQIIVAMI